MLYHYHEEKISYLFLFCNILRFGFWVWTTQGTENVIIPPYPIVTQYCKQAQT